MADESRVGSFTYIHLQTGLRKILELHEIYLNGNKLISLFWKDNKQDEDTVAFYDKKLRIDLFVKDLNGETPREAYEFDDIWKLTSMINVGLISERYKKKAFVMTEEAATAEQNGNEQSYYFTLLRWSDASDWTVPTGMEYLDRMWELNTPNSPLRFVAIHTHKVLVNYHSELKLCMEEEGPTKARNYMQQTGKRVLEAFYGSTNSSIVKQLTITEADDDDGTEGGVFIEFGSQTIRVIKIYEKEYLKNGEPDWDNLWKVSVKIRVSLICEQNIDKLKELLM
ncbi:unnamed protein product [Orchesella dallaii]|uniref:Uncharacterized protein n=1 Tax=Orchesella dallaii TaxID=48710 RepID=A0ABP1RMN3_9HEXA